MLAHRALGEHVGPWLTQFPHDRRHVIAAEAAPEWQLENGGIVHHAAETAGQMNEELKLIGPADVLVNLLPRNLLPADVADHEEMWWRLYLHLRPGGLYVLDRGSAPGAGLGAALGAWVAASAGNGDGAGEAAVPAMPDREVELVRSTSAALVSRGLIIVRKRGKHYVKLRDAEANGVLQAREPRISVRELAALSAGEATSRAVVTSHEASVPIKGLPEILPYPVLRVRHYQGRIAFAGSMLMFGENTILPDSFRHPFARDFSHHRKLTNISITFARIPGRFQPEETLAGNYYQLDSRFSGHFGHLTTEVLSRIWGWDQAKELIPDLKVIFRKHPREPEPRLERRFFEAYGIAPDDIVWTDRPVYLESVVSASPMWHNAHPYYAHPGMRDVWERLGRALIDPAAPARDRIFVSRGGHWKQFGAGCFRRPSGQLTEVGSVDRRHCRNSRDVEHFFASNGFTVIYPEELDLSQQASLFAGARVIAGFGGSAMFNMMFAKKMTTAIVLSHEAYRARNEHLFTSLLGGDVHYFWSVPDIQDPEGGSREAFMSDWEFDFERNRKPLEELITSL